MRTCDICGRGYRTRGEDILIYGCRACHKGYWETNQKELLTIEIKPNKGEEYEIYPYGRAKVDVELDSLALQRLRVARIGFDSERDVEVAPTDG